jgi:hypothetical protein
VSWAEVRARIEAGVLKAADTAALTMEREAIRKAPQGVSEPGINKGIHSEAKEAGGVITARCFCDSPHGAYLEFGTGPAAGHAKYMPPPGALRQWVSRKLGIQGEDAIADVERAIRWKIYAKGTEAQPFMGPAYQKVAPKWKGMLVSAIRGALRG